MAGACFSQDRSRQDDNTRTHRHLGATIVKLGQVKARSVWDLLLGGRTGAGYRLGIIVLDCCRSISRGMHVPYAYPSGWSWRRHRFINRPDTREKCAFTTTLPFSLYLAFALSLSLSLSLALFFSFSISFSHRVSLPVSWGRLTDSLLSLLKRSQVNWVIIRRIRLTQHLTMLFRFRSGSLRMRLRITQVRGTLYLNAPDSGRFEF